MSQLLHIKLTGPYDKNARLCVDGRPVKLKKNSFGSREATVTAEGERASVTLTSCPEVGGLLWFVVNLLLFAVSLFGLFDVGRSKSTQVTDLSLALSLTGENTLSIAYARSAETGDGFVPTYDGAMAVERNLSYVDEGAKKRFFWLRLAKIITAALLILAALIFAL